MPVQVANVRKHYRTETEVRVYIGRANQDYSRSPLANPFHRRDAGSKEQAIAQYRTWLKKRLQEPDSSAAREVVRLGRLVARGAELTLLCWCSPSRCHGDVVKEVVEQVAARLSAA